MGPNPDFWSYSLVGSANDRRIYSLRLPSPNLFSNFLTHVDSESIYPLSFLLFFELFF